MAQTGHKPEEIVAKLRQMDVLVSQGRSVAEAVRTIGVTQFTYHRWWRGYGGPKTDQLKRLKELEKENARLRKAMSDLTLEKLILPKAASGNFIVVRADAPPVRASANAPSSSLRRACHGEVAPLGAARMPGPRTAPPGPAQGGARGADEAALTADLVPSPSRYGRYGHRRSCPSSRH